MIDLLAGTKLVVETTTFPPIEVDLATVGEGEPSPATKLLRPRVSVYREGTLLYRAEPHGDPTKAPNFGLLLVLAAAVVAIMLLL